MIILGIDLGSSGRKATKSYATVLNTNTGEIERTSCPTTTDALLGLLGAHRPDRVVVEQTVGTGWFVDMCRGARVAEVQVANPRDPAWRNRTSKTDRQDADLLAHLSASGQIRTVHVPEDHIRQWRVLIDYRHELVHRRTRIKNRIKALLRNRGLPTGTLWNADGMARLRDFALPMDSCMITELWRGELHTELAQLEEIQQHLTVITERLDQLVEGCAPARALAQLDGIGPRTAEAVISTIDDPLRFTDRKKIGSYLGVVPRVRQSGAVSRYGGITKAGNAVVRTMLTQVVQSAIRRKEGWINDIYQKIHRADERCPNRAALATVRRVAIILWAKFRDQRRAAPTQPLFKVRAAA
jgi:transposase